MKIIELFKNIKAFEFDELIPYKTYVYAIERENKIYLIDTFCGSFYMEKIKELYTDKEFVVINTHYHFDHIWGNIAFKDTKIYAHENCLLKIKEKAKEEMKLYISDFKGSQKIYTPTCLFKDTLILEKDLFLKYTPGHTIDSISIIDTQNKAIFVGDNLEKPLIQLEEDTLDLYKKTLQSYLTFKDFSFHSGHTFTLTIQDISDTLNYLENFNEISFKEEKKQNIHLDNMKKMHSQ